MTGMVTGNNIGKDQTRSNTSKFGPILLLSTIFQLYHDGAIQRKAQNDLSHVTVNLILSTDKAQNDLSHVTVNLILSIDSHKC
jgi:hypothetical protein